MSPCYVNSKQLKVPELQGAAKNRVTEMMVLSVTQAHGPSCVLCLWPLLHMAVDGQAEQQDSLPL